MKPFASKTFNIPALKGISQKNIEEHLKLYEGYVKNANLILGKISEPKEDVDPSSNIGATNTYMTSEMSRHFGFEYNGMRNHEIYFSSFEGGPKPLMNDSKLQQSIVETWGSFDAWLTKFKTVAMTRGIGWAILYFDRKDHRLLNAWIDEQHLGQLQDCAPVLALDMWEHAYVYDYQPSGKKNYIEDFFSNLNWETIENNLGSI